jgi:hypothetical protein
MPPGLVTDFLSYILYRHGNLQGYREPGFEADVSLRKLQGNTIRRGSAKNCTCAADFRSSAKPSLMWAPRAHRKLFNTVRDTTATYVSLCRMYALGHNVETNLSEMQSSERCHQK